VVSLNIPKKLLERAACEMLDASYCLLVFRWDNLKTVLAFLLVEVSVLLNKAFLINALAEFIGVWTPFIFSPLFCLAVHRHLKRCVCGLPKPI